MTTLNQSICGDNSLSSGHQQVKEPEIESIRREDLAWLAGFFDGEGNINMGIYGNGSHNPRWRAFHISCGISNTHAYPVEKITKILNELKIFFKCHLRHIESKEWRICWMITVTGQGQAVKFLKYILPYLTNKKEQALQAIYAYEYRQTLRRGGNNRFKKDAKMIWEDEILQVMCRRMKELCHYRPNALEYSRQASQRIYCKKPSETTRLNALKADDIVRSV